jgi:quinol monooxygenase YgiN
MINVLAAISVKPGKRDEFLEIFKANVPAVLAEDGCHGYVPAVDVETGLDPQVLDENVVTIIEQWESLDALRAHLAAPHMATYREKVKDLVAGVSLKVLTEA